MSSLAETLRDPDKARAVVKDGARLVEQEVAGKRGLTGKVLRLGYRSVLKVEPRLVEKALGHLLPEFAPAVDPYYQKGKQSGNVKAYFSANASSIADAMLAVTDKRAEGAKNRMLLKAYRGLRPQAKKHTMEAVPQVGELIERHVE